MARKGGQGAGHIDAPIGLWQQVGPVLAADAVPILGVAALQPFAKAQRIAAAGTQLLQQVVQFLHSLAGCFLLGGGQLFLA